MAALLGIEATINQHLAFVKGRDKELSADYLCRFFQMAYSRMRADSEGGGSTKAAITCAQIANMRIPIPPKNERGEIVDYLSKTLSDLQSLETQANVGVTLLAERRAALISAAVTGKIDVREAA